MAADPTTPRKRGGIAVWWYLSALVAVPLVGVGVLATLVVVTRGAQVGSAARAEDAIRTVARLDAVRAATEQEILPALALVVIDDLGPRTSSASPRCCRVECAAPSWPPSSTRGR